MPPQVETHLVNTVLTNGARYYVDHAHPEFSTPECLTPLECLVYDKAGEEVMRRSMIAAQARLPEVAAPIVYKNNSDGKGNSYGCHENYMMDRAVPFARVIDGVVPHFVSRTIFTGSGKVGVETSALDADTVHFQISQRAEFFEEMVGLETTAEASHRQHPGRAPRRPQAVPPPPRHRRRRQPVRDRHPAQGRFHRHRPGHGGGRGLPRARPDPGRSGAGPAPGLGRPLALAPARPGRWLHRHRTRDPMGALRRRPQVRRGARARRPGRRRGGGGTGDGPLGVGPGRARGRTPPPSPTRSTGWPSSSSSWPTRSATGAAGAIHDWPHWRCSTTTCVRAAPSTSGWAFSAWSPWPSPTRPSPSHPGAPVPGSGANALARWPDARWSRPTGIPLVFDIGTDPLAARAPMRWIH